MDFDYIQLTTGQVALLNEQLTFPPPSQALKEPNGLVAIGGDLTPQRIINAYKNGYFPLV